MGFDSANIVRRYFRDAAAESVCGNAVVALEPGIEVAVAVDTLVADIHFYADAAAADIGWKCLAVNLSDLAAMAAAPVAATVAMTIPDEDKDWLRGFSAGLYAAADAFAVNVVGVWLTPGPLAVTVQIYGAVPPGIVLRRSGARPGDGIYVTGTLGDAGLALLSGAGTIQLTDTERQYVHARLQRPVPRVAASVALRGIASSAIDVSDGLAADLGHVLKASGCGATVIVDQLPVSSAFKNHQHEVGSWNVPLTAGDDYELCFTVPKQREAALAESLMQFDCSCTRIGSIEAGQGLRLRTRSGDDFELRTAGWDHFATEPPS